MEKKIRRLPRLKLTLETFSGLVQPFPAHFHEELVIGLMTEGRRTLRIRGETMEIGPGSLFVIPACTSHQCVGSDSSHSSWKTMRLESDWQPVLTVLRDESLVREFEDLHDTFMVLPEEKAVSEEQALAEFFRHLKQKAGTLSEDPIRDSACILHYMQQHCAGKLTLQDLTEAAGCSPSSLQRLCSRETGLSIHRALESIRVEKARKLMETGVPVAQAAAESGFADQAHFTNVFARFRGITPGNWIREKEGHQ